MGHITIKTPLVYHILYESYISYIIWYIQYMALKLHSFGFIRLWTRNYATLPVLLRKLLWYIDISAIWYRLSLSLITSMSWRDKLFGYCSHAVMMTNTVWLIGQVLQYLKIHCHTYCQFVPEMTSPARHKKVQNFYCSITNPWLILITHFDDSFPNFRWPEVVTFLTNFYHFPLTGVSFRNMIFLLWKVIGLY